MVLWLFSLLHGTSSSEFVELWCMGRSWLCLSGDWHGLFEGDCFMIQSARLGPFELDELPAARLGLAKFELLLLL